MAIVTTWKIGSVGQCQMCENGEGEKVVCSNCVDWMNEVLRIDRPLPEFVKNFSANK